MSHTSHVTRHTSHITRHTSHVTYNCPTTQEDRMSHTLERKFMRLPSSHIHKTSATSTTATTTPQTPPQPPPAKLIVVSGNERPTRQKRKRVHICRSSGCRRRSRLMKNHHWHVCSARVPELYVAVDLGAHDLGRTGSVAWPAAARGGRCGNKEQHAHLAGYKGARR